MPDYRAPGVYVEEVNQGPRSIGGVGTSTAGFLGETERGPTEPQFVSSYADFRRTFGGLKLYREGERLAGTYLAYGLEGFFGNGGGQCFVGRIEAEDMPTADAALGPAPPPVAGVLGASAGTLDFGIVPVGAERVREVTLTNLGEPGDDPVAVESVTVPAEFAYELADAEGGTITDADLPHDLVPDGTMTVTVTYAPGAAGDVTGTLEVDHGGASPDPLVVDLDGEAGATEDNQLLVDPTASDLGTVRIGDSVTAEVALVNAGATGDTSFDVSSLTPGTFDGELEVELLDAEGAVVDLDAGAHTLDGGAEATLVATLSPNVPGTRTASIDVEHGAGGPTSPVTVEFTVAGTALEADDTDVAFGTVGVGRSDGRTVTLTNVTDPGADIDVSAVAVNGDADTEFEVDLFTAGGNPIDLEEGTHTVAAGDTIEAQIAFEPEGAGTREATLSVTHGTEGSPTEIELSGDGGVLGAEAVGPGVWGSNVAVIVDDGSLAKPGNDLFSLTVRYWTSTADATVARQNDADTDLDAVPDPDVEEVYDNLSPAESSADYYGTRLEGVSKLIELTRYGPGRPGPSGSVVWLDAAFPTPLPEVDRGDYQGVDTTGERTGLAAFEEIDDIAIVCVPDEVRPALAGLTDDINGHCATVMQDRVAVLQAPGDYFQQQPNEMQPPVDSDYAAFYYPWLRVIDSETGVRKLVPPGGHVAGIYARSDSERGVHKAPANEVIRGVQELQVPVTMDAQKILNPKGINCIRSFPGRGIRVWGARTTSSDPLWRYLNVRRLFNFIEESIDEGTQWVVFEPNDERLWARVRQTVSNFLTTTWRNGALMGTTPEEAFYVKCDRSTMTQDDIDNGRLICEIGVAPVKPAEFVVFRISQWTGGAEGA